MLKDEAPIFVISQDSTFPAQFSVPYDMSLGESTYTAEDMPPSYQNQELYAKYLADINKTFLGADSEEAIYSSHFVPSLLTAACFDAIVENTIIIDR